jgi:ABC-type transport system substrate-binding protein
MMRGEIELLFEIPSESREFVEQESAVGIHPFVRNHVYSLLFNQRRPALEPRSVRIALSLAAGRDAIVARVLGGRGRPARGQLWPGHWAYRAETQGFDYDPSRALGLLGNDRGTGDAVQYRRLRFTCIVPAGVWPFEDIAVLLQQQFFEVGVDMQIEPVPIDALLRRLSAGDFDTVLLDLSGGPGLTRMYSFWHSSNRGASLVDFGYRSADRALDHLRAAADDRALEAAVREVAEVFHADPPAVFLCWPEAARALSRRFVVPPGDNDIVSSVGAWRIDPSRAAAP